jgi:hypothetical protein
VLFRCLLHPLIFCLSAPAGGDDICPAVAMDAMQMQVEDDLLTVPIELMGDLDLNAVAVPAPDRPHMHQLCNFVTRQKKMNE